MIDAHVDGVALTEQSLPLPADNETDDYAAILDVPVSEYPNPARIMLEFFDSDDRDRNYEFADEFTIGLELILDAIKQRQAWDSGPTPSGSAHTGR